MQWTQSLDLCTNETGVAKFKVKYFLQSMEISYKSASENRPFKVFVDTVILGSDDKICFSNRCPFRQRHFCSPESS